MKNKIKRINVINKINRIAVFLSAFIMFIVFAVFSAPEAYAGLVSTGLDSGSYSTDYGNYGDYIAVSAPIGDSVSVSIPAHEETPLISHALRIIRGNFELKKSALLNSDITFKSEEFDKILGVKLKYITITKLPDVREGVLTLGGSDVLEGQTVSRENIQYIRLVPYPDKLGKITFSFKNGDDTSHDSSISCIISVLSSLNFAPSANNTDISTQKNIPVFRNMSGTDPDDDDISYKIVQGPSKGTLEVKNASTGSFVYRPGKNHTGSDKFIYQAQDEHGNLSNPATVQIKVTKAESKVTFADLSDHWVYNSAVKAVAAGFIDVDKDDLKNPDLIFDPSRPMSRAAFVEMAIRAAKLDKNLPEVLDTGFADDSDIPASYKAHVKKAYELGIISGASTDTGLYFEPNDIITRAEAAVILNNILQIPFLSVSMSKPVFADAVYIPAWAEKDIAALNSRGIIKGDENGNINPYGLVDRAQSVEMLSNMADYNKSLKKSGGLFSFLFSR